MARKKQSAFEDLIHVASLLPWWAGLLLALISYFILHNFANTQIQQPANSAELGAFATKQLYRTFAFFGQLVLPIGFVFGAAISAFNQRKRKSLLSQVVTAQKNNLPKANKPVSEADPIKKMSWQEFELLISEFFRQQGYSVKETGKGGADGGVDLRMSLQGKKYLVQCKHWKAFKVGVKIIRELFGVMTAEGARGAFIVTSGLFTEEAIEFAQGKNITLIDGVKLNKIIREKQMG
ncbi:MAG: restriction endonuclease [Deltaproteobacteria bacterium]|nr:restriction endonuclease [Deltaproteobacteria bacterium]